MSVIARGVKNAFRNGVRTTSLVIIIGLSVGLALTMLVARGAINQKISSIKSAIGNTIAVSPAGARGFEGGGNALTESQVDSLKTLPHVTQITSTLGDRLSGTATNLVSSIDPGTLGRRFGRVGGGQDPAAASGSAPATSTATTFTLPVSITGSTTVNGSTLAGTQGGGTLKVTSGSTFDGTMDANIAIIGTALATKNNLAVGSTFTAYATLIKVVGIYDSGNTFSNAGVILPLPTLQRLSAQPGSVTAATVTVDSVANLSAVTTAVKSKMGTAADVTSAQDSAITAITPLENIAQISVISLIGALVAGAVIILLTMLMIVRERRREIGILKAIGSTNLKVMGQFMTEATVFTLLGSLAGLLIGVLAASPVTKLLATSATTTSATPGGPGGFGGGRALRALGVGRSSLTNLHAVVSWDLLLYGLGFAIVIALLGSAIPSLLISRVRPAEVMRAD
jgi:putative ABC transport system permease protein